MPRLIWTPEALQGVRRCHRFLAGRNPAAASRAVRAIRDGMRTIEAHPNAGRAVEHLPPDFREWPIPFGASGYLVRYRVEDDRIVVLVLKHRRDAGDA